MASTVWNVQTTQMNEFSPWWKTSHYHTFNVDLKEKLLPFRHTWLNCREHQWTWFRSW